ncbi:MAG: hypothetical protein ACM3YO_01130, partial [Bacteroidota bacterium]
MVSEDLCFKRLAVAHKRQDWRMYAQGLEKLTEEIGQFKTRSAARWHRLFADAKNDAAFPGELLETLERLLQDLVPEKPPESPTAPIAVIRWTQALAGVETSIQEATGESRSLADQLDRANMLGALEQTAPWMERLYFALSRSLARGNRFKGIQTEHSVCILTDDPGLGWERLMEDEGTALDRMGTGTGIPFFKLNGSLDWFYCPRCQHLTLGHERALVFSCEECGGPGRPLIVPSNAQFFPAPMRELWERARQTLAGARAWILIEPEEGPLLGMLEKLQGEKPILVRSERPNL